MRGRVGGQAGILVYWLVNWRILFKGTLIG